MEPFDRSGPLLEAEGIIRKATWNGETLISLAELKRRMHQISLQHRQVRDLVDLLVHMGRISETSAGVEYTYMSAHTVGRLGHAPL